MDMLPVPSAEAPAPPASGIDLAWEVTKLSARQTIAVNAVLIAAYQAASSPHSIRALKSDLEAFDLWCRRAKRIRAGLGRDQLDRYKASVFRRAELQKRSARIVLLAPFAADVWIGVEKGPR
ncbi:hypothetical protein [Sphingomonas paucimobilis]|uniref:hypothetical protein n=1 Tax=Sphingomonas paucimobilis TaxID=13689 RepID=UPI00203BDDB3|nr:hypothetical protein [Sphingomonas paucimobilis]MCM3681450.1 hypothetical protein [Sphingomonas paucimobilis]